MTTGTPPHSHDAEGNLPPEAERWLRAHPEADRAGLEEAWRLAALADDATSGLQPDPERVRRMEARIAAATRSAARSGLRPPVRPQRRRRRALGWAVAAVVVLIGIGLFLARPVRIAAPAGAIVAVDLPDGSTVELNSGSRLAYGRGFGGRGFGGRGFGRSVRAVRLEGEAFFDVARSETPFVVETFNSTVTVLGTRFNVRAWPESDVAATTVVLEEGRVRLDAGEADQAVVLDPGETSAVPEGSAAPAPPAPAELQAALAWRRGGFRFTDAPLGEIVDELERRTGAQIRVADPSLRVLRGTVLLDQIESADAVLAILAELRGLQVRRTADGFVLSQ